MRIVAALAVLISLSGCAGKDPLLTPCATANGAKP